MFDSDPKASRERGSGSDTDSRPRPPLGRGCCMQEATPPTRRRFLRAFQAACWLTLAFFTAHAGFGLGGKGLDRVFNDWVYNGLILAAAGSCIVRAVKVATDRAAWFLLGFGLIAW